MDKRSTFVYTKKRNKTKTYNYDKEWHFNQGNLFMGSIYQQ